MKVDIVLQRTDQNKCLEIVKDRCCVTNWDFRVSGGRTCGRTEAVS